MPNIKLVIEYDGSKFHGWQKQPNLRTIQSELENVLKTVLRSDETDVRGLTASGRTDAGVHARGQTVNFHVNREVDLHRLRHSVSSMMKGELSVLSAEIVADDFNACRDVTSKQYTYTILYRSSPAVLDYGRVWHVPYELNLELIKREAKALEGTHDFQSLRASGCGAKTSVKTIFSSELIEEDQYLKYQVIGKGFLKQMVRNIVGTLINLSEGKLEVKSMSELLSLKDRGKAGVTAPAHGLCLDWVKY